MCAAVSVTKIHHPGLCLLLTLAGSCFFAPVAAQSFPVDPSLPLVTGAFVQLNNSLASKSAAWWQTELGFMKSIGMDTVIVQYVAYNNSYYYPTSVSGGAPFGTDSIERILDAADQHGMNVHLGVHIDTSQFSGSFDLPANLSRGTATLNELHTRYGSHSSLAGWYMPHEFSDYTVFYDPALRDKLVTYTHDLTESAHNATGQTMMISPYFGQNPNGPAYAAWWDTTGLPSTGIDIFNLQDGVGTHRTTIAQSQAVFQAMAPVMANHNVAFWGNNESFNQIHGWPVDAQPFAAVPTDINTFKQQIQSTTPLVEKSVTFEFTTYMSTQGTAAANVLYQDYQDYYNDITSPGSPIQPIEIASYAYDNPPSTYFNSFAGDPSNALLIDGGLGSLTGGPGGAFGNGSWVGFGDDTAAGGPQPRVIFDLGGERRVDSIELTYLVAAGPFIFAPQEVPGVADALTVEISTTGVSFTETAFSNNFVHWATDQANGAFERRSVILDLGGVLASHLAIDVRTPNTWIFLGEFQAFPSILPGDYDGDGLVGPADLQVWRSSFGSNIELAADGNGDRIVDAADYVVWRKNFGAGAGATAAASAAVAEPATCTLLAVGAVTMRMRRRTNCHRFRVDA